jgi:hypothetical protein
MVTRGRKAPFKVLPLVTKAQPADDQAVALKALTDRRRGWPGSARQRLEAKVDGSAS